MPAYHVLIKASAEKELDVLAPALHARATAKILGLGSDPRPPGSQKLPGGDGYRLRIGDYRILYAVDDDRHTVTIFSVAHRREAYR
ncbi:MAG: type II toxin-antitoxin system RelE/ParE family toxin [Elusimicrobiota bacterium]